jgi:hypothetical protein
MRSIQLYLGIWERSQHLLKDRGKVRKLVPIWPVAGPSGCITDFQIAAQQLEKMGDSQTFP